MSLETELKNLSEAVVALTAALQAGATPAASPVAEDTTKADTAKADAKAKKKAEAAAKAKAKEEAEAKAAAELLDEGDGEPTSTVTRAELLNLVKALVKAKKLTEATDILKDHGAAKVSELDESDYDEVYAELKELED